MSKAKMKLRGQQLKDLQGHASIIAYAIEKALTDCFLRQEVFELLDEARRSAYEIERTLGV